MAGRDERGERPDHLGHRRRLRRRLLEVGDQALADYELLELLLTQALPRRDVKPIAKRLLKRFGSFARVISAETRELDAVDGMGEAAVAALKTVRAAAIRLTREEAMERPILSSWQKVLDYCRASMAFAKREEFRLLFLDRKNRLIADEVQNRGTVDHAPVYPREVVRRALDLGASALIMVHNHPSGDPTPSRSDIEMTREVREAAEKLGIALHDHIVIGHGAHASFKSLGLL